MNPTNDKEAIREQIRARRRELDAAWVRRTSVRIQERVMALPAFDAAGLVGCYMSLPREVQTTELLCRCWERGQKVCVPAFDTEKANYRMVLVEKGEEMVPGPAGIPEPRVACIVPPEDIDFVVVPGVAFDRRCVRLGHGGGHYDRLLSRCPGFKVGVSFEFQIVDDVPRGEHDIPMDVIVTEDEMYSCAGK